MQHKSLANKYSSKKNPAGVTLLLAILLLASILAICFSLATILFVEVRSSSDLLKTEPAFYAASGVGEQALFNLIRNVPASTYVSDFGNNVSLNGAPVVTSTSSPIFSDKVSPGSVFTSTLNKYGFCGTIATTSGCSYGKVTVSYIVTNSSYPLFLYLCQWNPNGNYTTAPCTAMGTSQNYWLAPVADSQACNSSQTLQLTDGSSQLTPTVSCASWNLDPLKQQELIMTNPYGSANIYFSIATFAADRTTPKGMPYVGKTAVVVNTQNGTVGRKLQVLVPNYTPTPTPSAGTTFSATGGTITYTDSSGLNPRSSPPYAGGYTVHTFTSDDTFTVTSGSGSVDYLLVAGGGSGGSGGNGGGGGAGGFRTGSLPLLPGSYPVAVGAGGNNYDGSDSTFASVTSMGGGKGGNQLATNGRNGGSGGGAGLGGTTYGLGTSGQGHNGGEAGVSGPPGFGAGGGGGAGGAGAMGIGASGTGVGGVGLSSSISGVSVFYAGGGGGANNLAGAGGGAGGGGKGAGSSPLTSPVAGSPNTGGGGGGATSGLGALGGSGIIIVRYPTP